MLEEIESSLIGSNREIGTIIHLEWMSKMKELLTTSISAMVQLVEEGEGPLDFEILSKVAAEQGNAMSAALMSGVMNSIAKNDNETKQHEEAMMNCPTCQKQAQSRGMRTRSINSISGVVNFNRPYFYCPNCKSGFSPADSHFKLALGSKQFDLSRIALNFLIEVPYEKASELFELSTKQKYSAHSMHVLANKMAEAATTDLIIPSAKDIKKIIEDNGHSFRRPVLVVSADGAMEPIRAQSKGRKKKRGPGTWKEAKGYRIYLLTDKRITQIASWHQICDHEEFGKSLAYTAGLIPSELVRIALIADGAEWIWNHFRTCFPTGREILDYYHASEKIYEVANVHYGKDTKEAAEWWEATMARLSEGEVKSVINGLSIMRPETKEAEETIRKFKGYLEKREEQFGYSALKKAGMPRGSGGIESANKYICHVRLKRSGAWWYNSNANQMLRLRCAKINGTLDKIFDKYKDTEILRECSVKEDINLTEFSNQTETESTVFNTLTPAFF